MPNSIKKLHILPEHLKLLSDPCCNSNAIVQGEHYRFSILTPELIRMEYNEQGYFEDRATQCMINRHFPVPKFQVIDHGNKLEIITTKLQLSYNKTLFSRHGLNVRVRNTAGHLMSVGNYGDKLQDLGGTARTLDNTDETISLKSGPLSRSGYTLVDDSHSLLLEEDGKVERRVQESLDLYIFGHGHDYLSCLKDFYHSSGRTPLLPRYALCNWWSRYYRFVQLLNR